MRTCVGSLQLLRHTDAQPVSSRYRHLSSQPRVARSTQPATGCPLQVQDSGITQPRSTRVTRHPSRGLPCQRLPAGCPAYKSGPAGVRPRIRVWLASSDSGQRLAEWQGTCIPRAPIGQAIRVPLLGRARSKQDKDRHLDGLSGEGAIPLYKDTMTLASASTIDLHIIYLLPALLLSCLNWSSKIPSKCKACAPRRVP